MAATPEIPLSFKKPAKEAVAEEAEPKPKLGVKQRRKALKEFYKQKQQEHAVATDDLPSDIPAWVATALLPEILTTYTTLLTRLNGAQAEIKLIVYNNYYELIKLTEVLEGVGRGGAAAPAPGLFGGTESTGAEMDDASLRALAAAVEELALVDTRMS